MAHGCKPQVAVFVQPVDPLHPQKLVAKSQEQGVARTSCNGPCLVNFCFTCRDKCFIADVRCTGHLGPKRSGMGDGWPLVVADVPTPRPPIPMGCLAWHHFTSSDCPHERLVDKVIPGMALLLQVSFLLLQYTKAPVYEQERTRVGPRHSLAMN